MATMETLLVALVSLTVGALLGGVVNVGTSAYLAFKEARGIAGGLRMEIDSIVGLVRVRDYLGSLDQIIARLEREGHHPDSGDVFSPPVTQEYFRVFIANCPKLGLLRAAGPPTVRAYMLAQAVIEDFRHNSEVRRLIEGGRQIDRTSLLRATRELRDVLNQALKSADQAVAELKSFETQRWLSLRQLKQIWKN